MTSPTDPLLWLSECVERGSGGRGWWGDPVAGGPGGVVGCGAKGVQLRKRGSKSLKDQPRARRPRQARAAAHADHPAQRATAAGAAAKPPRTLAGTTSVTISVADLAIRRTGSVL